MNTRLLGGLAIVASLIAFADGIRLVLIGHRDVPGFRDLDTIQILTQLAWSMGHLCAWIGLMKLKVTGTNPIFRFLSYLPAVGWVTLILGWVVGLMGVPIANNPLGLVGSIVAPAGLLVLAILVLAAKTWVGWRRYTPLVRILTIPLGAVVVGITGLDGWFILINAAATVLLGYAVLSSDAGAHLQRSSVRA